jgi:hypothetical protein
VNEPTPIPPTATPDEAALLRWAEAHPTDRTPPPIERGRYKLPDPDTSKTRGWTRVTTLAGTTEDTYHLGRWADRTLAAGLVANRDLLKRLAAVDDLDADKNATAAIIDTARWQAGGTLGRELGTAIHTATEHHDLDGRDALAELPAAYHADVKAYRTALRDAGLTTRPEWVERVIVNTVVDAAGTLDRIVIDATGRHLILDVKTQGSLDFGARKIAAQLATYAHAAALWRLDGDGYEPMPDVDRTVAIVAHMPVGSGTCTLHAVDLVAGWQAAQLCATVRRSRRGESKLITPYTPATEQATPPTDRTAWLRERLATVTTDEGRALVAKRWPADTPHRPPWTDEQIDAIAAVLDDHDAAARAPFGHEDPAATVARDDAPAPFSTGDTAPLPPAIDDTTDTAERHHVDDMLTAARNLPDATATIAKRWAHEARTHRRPWGNATEGQWSNRCLTVNAAALACLHSFPDDTDELTRAAVAAVLATPIPDHWPTGAVIGCLTVDQAAHLATLAADFRVGQPTAIRTIGLAVAGEWNHPSSTGATQP